MLLIQNKNRTLKDSLKELSKNSYKDINKKDKKGRTILHDAVGALGQKTVRLLIKKGADINAADVGGYVPMHLAVIGNKLQNVQELISSGADVNIVEHHGQQTPLHFACMLGEVEMVKELIKAGAKTDQPDKSGKTPTDHARNSKEIVEVLKDAKIANIQGEFLEKVAAVSERTASIILEKKKLEKSDES